MTTMTWGNPYTHEEHTRECITNFTNNAGWRMSCAWCGTAKKRLYRYDGSIECFCDKNCYKDYKGL